MAAALIAGVGVAGASVATPGGLPNYLSTATVAHSRHTPTSAAPGSDDTASGRAESSDLSGAASEAPIGTDPSRTGSDVGGIGSDLGETGSGDQAGTGFDLGGTGSDLGDISSGDQAGTGSGDQAGIGSDLGGIGSDGLGGSTSERPVEMQPRGEDEARAVGRIRGVARLARPGGAAAAVGSAGAAGLLLARAGSRIRPVPVARWVNPLPGAAVTSCFGVRWGRLHAGVDLATTYGTPIRAAGAGIVIAAGADAGYGNAVLIDHGNGFLTHYGHMSIVTARAGQHVGAGERIGSEGSTGHSTGPHLHFEVHQGAYKNPIEPTRWMREHGVDLPGCG